MYIANPNPNANSDSDPDANAITNAYTTSNLDS
jgi:hypothetical protein